MLRLHPLSWLFTLLTQLRSAVFPLVVLLIFGRGQWWELFLLVGAGAYALYAFIYSVGFRYRIAADELLVKEGIFSRTERHIPFARIQNIVRKRNPLHRIFNVTELRLESAGGTRPEAVMNVITVSAADEIESILRRGAVSTLAPGQESDDAPALLQLRIVDLIRLGLMRQRGGLLIGAAIAFAFQFDLWESRDARGAFFSASGWIFKALNLFSGPASWLLAALAFFLAFYLVLQLFSVAWAVVNFYGFRLRGNGTRLSTEYGLLTRHAASARLDKVQRLIFGESLVARLWGYRWLSCDIAAGRRDGDEAESSHSRLRWLAPVAPASSISRLADQVSPGLNVDRDDWQALHPGAARRLFKKSALMWTAACFWAGLLFFGYYAVILWLALMIYSALEARGWAKFSGYACADGVIAFRSGYLTREWVIARVSKGQGVEFCTSPFDRRAEMASVEMATAGASASGSRLRIPYMHQADARTLFDRISAELARLDDAGRPSINRVLVADIGLQ